LLCCNKARDVNQQIDGGIAVDGGGADLALGILAANAVGFLLGLWLVAQ